MRSAAVCLALIALGLASLAREAGAEGTLWGEVQRTSVNKGAYLATYDNTPSVWKSGLSPCRTVVRDRTYGTVYDSVPLPAYFDPDLNGDAQAVLVSQVSAPHSYYEFDLLRGDGWTAGGCHKWSARFVTTESAGGGVQAAGLPYVGGGPGGGVPRFAELGAGAVPHRIQVEVPVSCSYFKAPAIRRDSASTIDAPNCIPEGQVWQLPASTSCALAFKLESWLCAAMRDYGLVATDQTHDKVTIRLEGVKRSGGGYQGDPPGNPYWDVGGWFQCHFPGDNNCQPEWITRGIPWAALVKMN